MSRQTMPCRGLLPAEEMVPLGFDDWNSYSWTEGEVPRCAACSISSYTESRQDVERCHNTTRLFWIASVWCLLPQKFSHRTSCELSLSRKIGHPLLSGLARNARDSIKLYGEIPSSWVFELVPTRSKVLQGINIVGMNQNDDIPSLYILFSNCVRLAEVH
jgi:hypothetical protein